MSIDEYASNIIEHIYNDTADVLAEHCEECRWYVCSSQRLEHFGTPCVKHDCECTVPDDKKCPTVLAVLEAAVQAITHFNNRKEGK